MKIFATILAILLIEAAIAFRIPESLESLTNGQSDDGTVTDPVEIDEGKEIPDSTEGDIKLSPQMKEELKNTGSISKRNAQRNMNYLWSGSTIPYEIDAVLADKTDLINQALNEYHTRTCIKFIKRTNQAHWIKFVKKIGCWSYIGRQYSTPGAQDVSLGDGCYHKKTIVHELMHALGFWHEQSRTDRDKNVEIFWEHVKPDKESNFVRYGSDVINNLDVIYDIHSIVHYDPFAFSINGAKTLTAVGDPQDVKKIGPLDHLSELDVIKIERLYCKDPAALGLQAGGPIPDGSFTASSYNALYGDIYLPSKGRLNSGTAWCAGSKDDLSSYLQVDLGSVIAVRKVATQGNAAFSEWVTKYSIKYSSDKAAWHSYSENGAEKIFVGNTDKSTIVKNTFSSPISARYFRFYPKERHEWPCMRVELYNEPATMISPWSQWGPCNRQSCLKMRQRFCTSPDVASKCPSADAHGVVTQTLACTSAECNAPVDGHWNRWGAWGACTKTCGLGSHSRTRTCTDPAPLSGGKNCVGSNTMTAACQATPCDAVPEGCSFTKDYCKWSQEPSANIPWYRRSYSTPSSKTGPSRDHTSPDGSGYYIYLEASGVAVGSKAILQSGTIAGANGDKCLVFYYHKYGIGQGTLNAKLKKLSSGTTTTLATLTGNLGDNWLEKKVTFQSSENFQILIEGIRGSSFSSDMAVDDIKILAGACS